MNTTQKNLLFALAAIIALAAGMLLGINTQEKAPEPPPPIKGTILPIAKVLNDFQLVDHHLQSLTKDSLKNQWTLVFMGYTNCPDICPTTLSTLRQVSQLMEEQQLKAPTMLFISADPDRDTPDLLRQYVTYFNKDYLGATGDEKEIAALAKQLAVFYKKVPGTSGDINQNDYLIDHSSSLMLINPDGNLQAYLTAPHSPMQIIDSIIRTRVYFEEHSRG